jgi:signal transduction histidine kinase
LPSIYVARSQLGQVFTHLIVNACQAIGDGPGHLTIDANSDGKVVAIKFTDTGCGIPEAIVDRIFEPLFTTKQEGTGLGLSVMHSIVKAYNGRIDVNSVEGKGTTFTVTFPIEKNGVEMEE